MRIQNTLLFVFILSCFSLSQSIVLKKAPAHLQLFPRDNQDSAVVQFSGDVVEPGFGSISLKVYKDETIWREYQQALSYVESGASFLFNPKIHAERTEFHFELYLDDQFILRRDSIVCGDVYLINGQSNSHPNSTEDFYQNEFCRSFGRHTDYEPYNPADTTWGIANGSGWCDSCLYAVGRWGMRLQRLILENYGIPTCIINGGSGGSSIEYNLPDQDNPLNLETTYGRLLYRAQKAGVADNIKAMLWHQGESDANSSGADNYLQRFTELSNAWRNDYQPLDWIYVFQLHPSYRGCGDLAQDRLREIQRAFPDTFTDVQVMSTCGLPGHDGCHYNDEGYNQMATRISRLVARDFYGSDDVQHISPPNVQETYFSNEQNTEITVIFDQAVIWPEDTLGHSMKDYFFLDGISGMVDSGWVGLDGNSIVLELNSFSNATQITYLPNHTYHGGTLFTWYRGPWIRNPRGVAALSFHEFPIEGFISSVKKNHPSGLSLNLLENYPNPFNNETVIRYSVGQEKAYGNAPQYVRISIYNVRGQKITELVSHYKLSGQYKVKWRAGNFPSGMYYLVLRTQAEVRLHKMLLIK